MSKATHHLPYLQFSGSHYEIGVQLGQFGAQAVHSHLLNSPAWAELSQWRGSAALKAMQHLVQENFPLIWQELLGLAAGLNLSIEDTFIWNCRGDLWAMAPDGCSTILQLDPVSRITHNQDGDPNLYVQCAVVQFKPDGGPTFTSFVYPGSLPGHSFAVNEYDLVMTVNSIHASHTQPGTPRIVLCRAIMNCIQVKEAVNLLRDHARAGAFHLSLSGAGGNIHSVEFHQDRIYDLAIDDPMFHANHAIHSTVRHYPQIITGSSGYRQIQGDAMIKLSGSEIDALAILADDTHRFPIYRRLADDPDNENTLATADFIYTEYGLEWNVYDGPLNEPVLRFRGQDVLSENT